MPESRIVKKSREPRDESSDNDAKIKRNNSLNGLAKQVTKVKKSKSKPRQGQT